jgi:hypothetical protein
MRRNSGFGAILLLFILWAGPPGAAHAAAPFAFPAVPGWNLAGQPQVFSPDTLYDYIDGAADLYLKYECEELQVAEYRKGTASVTAEVYRHRDANHAFGIYSQERLPGAVFLAIGSQGYYETAACNFIQGNHYVKLTSENTGAEDRETLQAFARRLSQDLAGPSALPGILSAFPSEGKKQHSEKFIAKDFLGYAFLHSGFTADYERSGQKYQLFVITGETPDDARTMLAMYLKQIRHGTNVAEGMYQVTDPYHGDLALLWRGKYIWGTMSLRDPDLRAAYLTQFEAMSTR